MKFSLKSFWGIITIILIISVPMAFGAGAQEIEVESETVAEQPAESSNITVTDSIGNKVLIPAGDKKVASLRSGITEIICALGAVDSIIAVDEMTKEGYMYGEFISSAYPQLMEQTAPYAGRDVNIEELLSIEPDLVLHGGFGRIRQADSIKNQAPELPVVIAHFETLDAYMDDIRIVGKCVNAEDRSEVLINYLQQKLDMIKELTKKIPEDGKKSVFYGGHDVYHAYGGNTFEHFQIVNAGGVNPAESLTGWMPEVSPEQLLNWNPDVIILLNGADVEAVMNDDRIESISAIRNGNVYALPQAGWDFSTPRALFCIEWIFSLLYPEEYSSFDINKQVEEFFMQVFNVSYEGPVL